MSPTKIYYVNKSRIDTLFSIQSRLRIFNLKVDLIGYPKQEILTLKKSTRDWKRKMIDL
ncbi:MAG: hypothetical protein HGN29_14145 [Asgard group archaeon]|nr:hypothetical protein [Asgard group archaeon]